MGSSQGSFPPMGATDPARSSMSGHSKLSHKHINQTGTASTVLRCEIHAAANWLKMYTFRFDAFTNTRAADAHSRHLSFSNFPQMFCRLQLHEGKKKNEKNPSIRVYPSQAWKIKSERKEGRNLQRVSLKFISAFGTGRGIKAVFKATQDGEQLHLLIKS